MQSVDINEIINKYKIPGTLGLVGVVLIAGGLFLSSSGKKPEAVIQFPKESVVENQKIMIDVSGAVINPGVYQLDSEKRVEDAIKAAGGLSDNANAEYISKYLNMAQKIADGMKIYVPFQGDPTPPLVSGSAGQVAGVKTNGSVNINTGSQAELEALPGIGPVTASKIISGRPYQKVDDLLSQKIVSKTIFDKIKDSLAI